MFCFTFVSDHNTDYIMLYSVQLKNMYSYLNSSLKLSDIVRGLSCHTDYIMLYSVQLKNMYSYLNSSLKLSDIVRGLSCQQSYCNLFS